MSAKRFMIIFTILTLSPSLLGSLWFLIRGSLFCTGGRHRPSTWSLSRKPLITLVIFVFRSRYNLWIHIRRLSAHSQIQPPRVERGIVEMDAKARLLLNSRRDCWKNHRPTTLHPKWLLLDHLRAALMPSSSIRKALLFGFIAFNRSPRRLLKKINK